MNRRGSALMFVLVTVGLLMVLLGAFVGIYRTHAALTGNELLRQQVDQACLSGLHYAWYQLELDSSWGVGPFSDPPVSLEYPSGGDVKLQVVEDLDRVYGHLAASGAIFEVEVLNNLEGRSPTGTLPDLVPARAARIQVVGRLGSVTRRLDAILRTHPLTNQSVLANGDILVTVSGAGAWSIESRDPYVNAIHSNDEIFLPNAMAGRLEFQNPPRNGRASSVTEIYVDGSPISTNDSLRASAEAAAEGTLSPGALPVDIPQLESDQVEMPENEVELDPGTYNFKQVVYEDWYSDEVVVGTDDAGNDILETRWGRQLHHYNGLALLPPGSTSESKVWLSPPLGTEKEPIDESSPLSPGAAGYQNIASGADIIEEGATPSIAPSVKANLNEFSLSIGEGTTVTVAGDFALAGEFGRNPSLLLATEELKEVPDNLAGAETAYDDPEQYSAALQATGNVTVSGGSVYGYGAITAGENISMYSRSQLWAAPDLGVALLAENIAVAPPQPESMMLLPNQALPGDWDVFNEGLQFYVDSDFSGDWAPIDDWLHLPDTSRNTHIEGIRDAQISADKNTVWAAMKAAYDVEGDADLSGGMWSGPMTIEKYIRLREYAKTAKLAEEAAGDTEEEVEGDTGWLEGAYNAQVHRLVKNQVTHYAILGEDSLQEYFAALVMPQSKDLFFMGLVYANQNLQVQASMNGVYFEGAVVTQGDMNVYGADSLTTVYNRFFLDDLLNLYPDKMTKLDQVYLVIR